MDNNEFEINKLCASLTKFGFIMALKEIDNPESNSNIVKSRSKEGGAVELNSKVKIKTTNFQLNKKVESKEL